MLLPREHGAYGQLLFPRLSALLIGRPAPGARALHEQGGDARRSVALFGGFCAVTGAVSLFVLPRPALIVLFLPALLVLLVRLSSITIKVKSAVWQRVHSSF